MGGQYLLDPVVYGELTWVPKADAWAESDLRTEMIHVIFFFISRVSLWEVEQV